MAEAYLIEEPRKAEAPAGSIPFAQLNQKHPDYDADLIDKLGLLYRGGHEIQRRAREFVPKFPNEDQGAYDWRCKVTGYVNLLARVVGHLTGSLFEAPLELTTAEARGSTATTQPDPQFYEQFSANCDLQGTPLTAFVQEAVADALVHKRALIAVDMPLAGDLQPVNRIQEDQLGLARAYLFRIHVAELINWEKRSASDSDAPRARFGDFEECILKRRITRSGPLLARDGKHAYEFKRWFILNDRAHYAVYRTKWVTSDDEIAADEAVELIKDETETSFRQIPICELNLPEALWAGDQAGPLCTEHFVHRSNLVGSLGRTNIEFAVLKRGPEIPPVHGAIMSETQQNPKRAERPTEEARRKGFVAIGSEDDLQFVGPSGRAAQLIREEVSAVREEVLGTVHTMALSIANSASALQRSGESKKEDRSATSVVLDLLGGLVRGFACALQTVISEARGERVQWKATGLDSYDDDDRAQVVAEATEVATLYLPSPTLKRYYATQVATSLVRKAPSAVKQKIAKELQKNITDEDALRPPTPDGGADEEDDTGEEENAGETEEE